MMYCCFIPSFRLVFFK